MRRKSRFRSWMVVISLLALYLFGLDWVAGRIDRWRFPWGYPGSGRPTLTGTWVGPLITGRGHRLGLLVEMGLVPLDQSRRWRPDWFRSRRSRWLEGRVLVCARPGRVQSFQAGGKPDDTETASRFHLAMSPADSAPLDGLYPSHLRGQWDGQNSLALEVQLYIRRGKASITSTADPDTRDKTPATLARGTREDFDALCRRLPA